MKKITAFLAPVALTLVLSACGSTTPNYDARFGDAVRKARTDMQINPLAGSQADPATGMDGPAARNSISVYQESFKTPPPVVNVINIGGGVGGK